MSNNPTPGNIASAVTNAFGPMENYAMGYMNPMGDLTAHPPSQGTGYIATMKLSVGSVSPADATILDEGTAGIVTYDRCETADANIGQINMGTASSFCGLNGALWGYHLAKADLKSKLYSVPSARKDGGADLDVYDATPLLDATYRLFGSVKAQRHPPLPGAHVICANKSVTVRGPAYAWSFIAIAIVADSQKGVESNLFIEDCGTIPAESFVDRQGKEHVYPTPDEVKTRLEQHKYAIARSVTLCGEDFGKPQYKAIYAAGRAIYSAPGTAATALACAPYVLLAQNDKPTSWSIDDLITSNIAKWEKEVWPKEEHPLPPYPYKDLAVVVPSQGRRD
ncbi:histidine decarboxylase, pyruvoyl type [Streptomyces sp. NPDC012623]|uniref:histidine decarboxylase, pyruvoyl type n=1 Tax=unclassified Streptomyces TaxID=2593676 RepID=UPI0036AE817A